MNNTKMHCISNGEFERWNNSAYPKKKSFNTGLIQIPALLSRVHMTGFGYNLVSLF